MKDPNAIYFWSKGPEEFRFLSNFYPAKIDWTKSIDGVVFSSAEHFFQAFKFKEQGFKQVLACRDAWEAKRYADSHKPDHDNWVHAREKIMYFAIREKFRQNPDLRELLLATGDFPLIHYAPWGDKFWGVGKDYEGENMQGKITMRVREELRK